MKWELWDDQTGSSFGPVDENYEQFRRVVGPNAKLIWNCEAKSQFDAMQQMYTYCGWGTYKPEPDWDDVIYDD